MDGAARYILTWALTLLALLVTTAAFNAAVDPYDLLGSPRIPAFNAHKPTAVGHTGMVKQAQARRQRPATVLIGSSRVDTGIDPASHWWPQEYRPVYNAGVPGDGISGFAATLQQLVARGGVHHALLGLGFEDFLGQGEMAGLFNPAACPAPAAKASTLAGLVQRGRDVALSLFTLRALGDSMLTVTDNLRGFALDIRPDGATTDEGFANVARSDGYGHVFAQKERDYLNRAMQLSSPGKPVRACEEWGQLQRMLTETASHGIPLMIVMLPFHVDLFRIYEQAHCWSKFENWKLLLVRLAAAYPNVTLWDFTGYSPYTSEPIPTESERRQGVAWFWDPVHFKKALGDILLERIFTGEPADFGTKHTSGTIIESIARLRRQRDAWDAAHPQQAARIAQLLQPLSMPLTR